MLLDEGVALDHVVDPVRREDVLQLEAVDARSIRLLHVEVVGVVVEKVGHADSERLGVAEFPVVDAIHPEMLVLDGVTADLQLAVDPDQPRPDLGEDFRRIHHRQPQGLPALRILVGHRTGEARQLRIDAGDVTEAVEVVEILPQRRGNRIHDFSHRDHLGRNFKL